MNFEIRYNFSNFQNVISNNPPPASVIMTHCVRKSICESPLKEMMKNFISILEKTDHWNVLLFKEETTTQAFLKL